MIDLPTLRAISLNYSRSAENERVGLIRMKFTGIYLKMSVIEAVHKFEFIGPGLEQDGSVRV